MEALSAPYDNLRVVELPPTQPLSAPVTKILVLPLQGGAALGTDREGAARGVADDPRDLHGPAKVQGCL